MDPVSAAVLGGANVLGGAMQGAVNEKTAKAGLNVEQLLGQRGLDVQSAAVGDQIRRQMESMPLRDRLLAQLQARMSQAPAGFNPAGMWGNANHPASTGGVDQGALQRAAANYQPGTGGTRPDIAAQMMNRLGYTPMGGSAFSQGGNEWQKTLGQKFGSAPQSWANTLVGTESGNLNTDPLRWASANVGHAGNQMTGLASTPGGGGQPEVFTNNGGNSIKGLPSGGGTSTGVIGNGLFSSDVAPPSSDLQPPTPQGMFPSLPNPQPPASGPTPDIGPTQPQPPSGGTPPPFTPPQGMFPSLPTQPPTGGNSLKDIAALWGGTLNPQPPTPEPPVASVQPPTGGPPPATGFTPSQLFPALPMQPTNPITPPSPSVPPPSDPTPPPPSSGGTPPGLFASLPMQPPPPGPSVPPPSNPALPPSGGAPPGPPVPQPPSMFPSLPNPGTPPPTNPAVPLPPQPPTPPTTPAIPSWQKAVAGRLMPRTPF